MSNFLPPIETTGNEDDVEHSNDHTLGVKGSKDDGTSGAEGSKDDGISGAEGSKDVGKASTDDPHNPNSKAAIEENTKKVLQDKQPSQSTVTYSMSGGSWRLPPVKVTPSQVTHPNINELGKNVPNISSFMLKEPKLIDENVRKSIFKTATKERSEKRFTWATNFDFSLVSMASVIGVSNFVVFPQKCKQHGGMAFCIPYVIVVIFMGLPLYFLETLLGQYSGHGTIAIMNELVPAFVGIGYALVVNNFVEFMRNEVDSARLLYLSIVTMEPTIPWAVCSASNSIACYTKADDLYCMDKFGNTSVFFNLTCTSISTICKTLHHVNSSGESCQQKNGSWAPYTKLIQRLTPEHEFLYRHILNMEDATLSHLGPIHWPMFFCLAACWLMTFSLGYNGFSTTAKSAYVTVFAPLLGQFLIFLKAFSLDGADEGIRAYLTFDATSLSSKHVWIDAIKTCFSSLSLGLGLIIAIGSANKPYKNCLKTTVVIIMLDTMVSLASGLGFFALIGHLAHTFHMTVEELLAGETDIMFTTLPLALTSLNFPRIYVIVCFTSATLVSFGYLTAVIAMTTYDGKDIFNSLTNRRGDQEKTASNLLIYQYNIITCTVGFTISIMFVVKGGSLVLEVTDVARHIDMSLIIASLQAIVICFFYGSGSLLDLVEDEMGITLGRLRPYWALSWNIVAPVLLLWAAFSVTHEHDELEGDGWRVFGSLFAFYPFLIVLGFFVIQIYHYRKIGIWRALQPTRKWCLGLDTALLVDAQEAEPEVWRREEVVANPPRLVNIPPSIVISSADSTFPADAQSIMEPLAMSPSGHPEGLLQQRRRSKSIFTRPAALAILGHTLHGNSYVPFERQMVEGERIRRESARI